MTKHVTRHNIVSAHLISSTVLPHGLKLRLHRLKLLLGKPPQRLLERLRRVGCLVSHCFKRLLKPS